MVYFCLLGLVVGAGGAGVPCCEETMTTGGGRTTTGVVEWCFLADVVTGGGEMLL